MTEKTNFLYSEFFTMTLSATVQRGQVYLKDLQEEDRKALQISLQQKLVEISQQYKRQVPEQDHERNILKLAEVLTASHAPILFNGRFRIGSAQKALNLFLKYLWCIGEIEEPPHCPFDFQIIQKLPKEFKEIRWTKIDDMGAYRKLVTAAKACAAPLSLAEWELKTYTT